MLMGELFSLISLAAGLFFFIFAARYYFSIAFVMVRKNRIANRNNGLNNNNHWRNNNGDGNGNNGGSHNGANNNNGKTLHNGGSHNGTINNGKTLHNGGTHLVLFRNGNAGEPSETVLTRVSNWVRKVILGNGVSYGNGENGENGSSKSVNNGNNNHRNNNHNNHQPFISIHLAFYNEKNVADRILTACASLNYSNYEVIVVDDSKDETVEILKKWQDNPRVKIIHREARKGWKGGALNEALKRMDPRAEYVMIFDADFIPPTDIIQQFLPYFGQGMGVNGNGNGNGLNNNNHGNNHPLNNHKTVNRNDYQRIIQKLESWYEKRELAVVQGYQWHYLNAGENWLTKGIRAEYSASYVIERTYQELTDAMKMISGSVFMIKADVLKKHGWSTSMTEDWELTVRLYLDGYKVVYTPYIQAPCECPSTIPQLVKQRMRWAEGHTYNAKKYLSEVIRSPKLSLTEKLEYAYYAPYYLQTFIFLIGTSFWFLSETMHQYLPFWTQVFGWSLLLSNFFSLPMMGLTGLFLEKNVQRDLTGIFSFIVMSYVLVPFIAYASLKGLLEKKERGTWIRTLKTGKITEIITKLELRKVWRELLPKRRRAKAKAEKKVPVPAKTEANGGSTTEQSKKEGEDKTKQNGGNNSRSNHKLSLFNGSKRPVALILLLVMSSTLFGISFLGTTIVPVKAAAGPDLYFHGGGAGLTGTMDENPGTAYLQWSGTTAATFRWNLQGGVSTPQTFTSNNIILWLMESGTGSQKAVGVTWTVYNTETGASIATGSGSPTPTVDSWNSYQLTDGDTGTIPAWNRIYITVTITPASGSKTVYFRWDGSTEKSELNLPGTILPENALFLLVLVPIIPLLMSRRKKKTSASQRGGFARRWFSTFFSQRISNAALPRMRPFQVKVIVTPPLPT